MSAVASDLRITVSIDYDQGTECPLDDNDGEWSLYVLSRYMRLFSNHNDNAGESHWVTDSDNTPTIALRSKLRAGLAFWLTQSYDELRITDAQSDGQALWVWEHAPSDMGAKTYDDRRKDAKNSLRQFNAWANGECYWYAIEGGDGEQVDSCGGFIGPDIDYMAVEIKDAILAHVDDHNKVMAYSAYGFAPKTVADFDIRFKDNGSDLITDKVKELLKQGTASG